MSASRAARFGQILRARRRQLDLTQEEVAKRIKSSQSFVYLLESGKRGLSETIMKRLAKVLGSDARKLFFLARPRAPHAHTIINLSPANPVLSARKRFKNDNLLRGFHDISDAEMEMLSHVASLGEARSARDFLYVLNALSSIFALICGGSLFLKILANAGSYGIFAELNRVDLPEGEKETVIAYGLDGPFSTRSSAIERPGEFYFPRSRQS